MVTRDHFGTGEPFTITVGGQRIYVLTSPNDVDELYRNTTTLSWEVFAQDLYRWIGFSPSAIKRLWTPPSEKLKALNPERNVLPPNQMMMEYHHRQLRPGEQLEILSSSMLGHIQERLIWERLGETQSTGIISNSGASRCNDGTMNISLFDLTSHIFINSLTECYWGKKIFVLEPDLLSTFTTWEETNWKYVYQLPRFLSRDMYAARDRLIGAFTRYFALPKSERKDANWFIPRAEKEMRDVGIGDEDLGRAHMLQHWA
ncbi:MAG: hypothetical protein Q9174_002367 [Haloplaca sp. 1 TL-2023]